MNLHTQLREILGSEPDETACTHCLSQLDEYVAAQLAGQDYLSTFLDVAAHLDRCQECAGAYARLYELELAVATEQLPQPEHIPAPDLSFLPLQPGASLPEQLRQAVSRSGDRLRLQLNAGLLSMLRPSPSQAPTRASGDDDRYTELLLQLEPDETLRPILPLTLTAHRDSQQTDLCLIEAVVEPPGQSWPDLAGRTVALVILQERREAKTDAWGLASFSDVPIVTLPELVIEVRIEF